MARRHTAAVLVALCSLLAGQTGSTPATSRTLIVEHRYESELDSLLKFAGRNVSTSVNLPSRAHLVDRLKAQAASHQEGTVNLLRARGARFKSFWICNCMAVFDANPELERELKELNGVANVRGQRWASIPEGEQNTEGGEHVQAATETTMKDELQWNIKIVAADKVWKQSGVTGEGVVVGTIDTGVRYTHEALRDHYRGGDHSWFDAEGSVSPHRMCLLAATSRF